jgi:TetR/AcrR family transcriptional regulator, fatty acid metabolism regulator protein
MNTHSLRIHYRRQVIATKVKSTDKYERILEAAITVFAEQGFHQATISQIARKAGVADGTIYLYFKNKDDIMVNFFDQRTKRAFSRFREAVERAGDAGEKLMVLIRTHLQEFQLNRDMAVVYQAETHRNNRSCEAQIREMSKMYLDIVSEIVEQGQQEGLVRKDLYLGLVKRFIIGAVDEVINTWLHSSTEYDLSSMAEPLVDLFLRGVGHPEETGEITIS